MRRLFAFILGFIVLVGSFSSMAASGDFIHTGLKKGYNIKNPDDVAALINDLKDKSVNKEQFYRELDDGRYVNVIGEQKAEEDAFAKLLGSYNVDIGNPYAVEEFLSRDGMADEVGNAIEDAISEIAKSFDDIEDDHKGSIGDYFKHRYAARLVEGENYSIPEPGFREYTTKITNLAIPAGSGANQWLVKSGQEDFGPLDLNDVISGGRAYNSGTDIDVSVGDYLLIAAVDGINQVKAYESIAIKEFMVRSPKVRLEHSEDLIEKINLTPSDNYSGTTLISGLSDDELWIAVLDAIPEVVYKSDKFNSTIYEDNMEIVMAKGDELDNLDENFAKYLMLYKKEESLISEYGIVEVGKDNVSGKLEALELISSEGDSENYHFTEPVKGNKTGTTSIKVLQGKDDFAATKWMYMVGDELDIPHRDMVLVGANDYNAGEDIFVKIGQDLLILAVNEDDNVRAYAKVSVTDEMVKNPVAEELRINTHFKNPLKGNSVGTTQFEFLKHGDAESWWYTIKQENIVAPELNTGIASIEDAVNLTLSNDKSGDLTVDTSEDNLKHIDGFKRYMMVYGVDNHGNIKVYKRFILDDTNVRMPKADKLTEDIDYSKPTKGIAPNTTIIEELNIKDAVTAFRYKLIDVEDLDIEFNDIISGAITLRANANIPTTVGRYLLILGVDGAGKTKAYDIVKLEFENVKAGPPAPLNESTHYRGPTPGKDNNTTSFEFLNLPNGGTKFVYKLNDTESISTIESGTEIVDGNGYSEVEIGEDIEGAAVGRYLLLVAVDSDGKVLAAREFFLRDFHVKGNKAPELAEQAYSLIKGDNPSTTKLKLEALGLDNPNTIRWRYKLVSEEPSSDHDKPYFNQIISDAVQYTVNPSTLIGTNIKVDKADDGYGYILLLATDMENRIKAYKYIEIETEYVKEHAPEIEGVALDTGGAIDSIKFDSLPSEDYMYLVSDTSPATPAVGDPLPRGVVEYNEGEDIVVSIGKYLTLYGIDENNKIKAYKTFLVREVKQGKASLSSETILEGAIRSGGSSFKVTLNEGAEWAEDVAIVKSIRDKLFSGFKADSETSEWAKVVASMVADGAGAIGRDSDTVITILLPQTLGYDIKEEQRIGLEVPAEAIKGAINPIVAEGSLIIKPTIGATITGDVVNSIVRESDIKAGGKTIVVNLIDGIWAADVSGIIGEFSGGGNWDKIVTAFGGIDSEVRTKNIKRNSGTMVTVTLPPVEGVDFGVVSEVISLIITKESGLVQNAEEDIIASPNFTLYPDVIEVKGKAVEEKDTVLLLPSDYKFIDMENDAWQVKVTAGTLKDEINDKDLVISGLPKGLVPNISKEPGNIINIKLIGTASTNLATDAIVKVRVKGSAVTEPNSVDSDDISLKLNRGESMMEQLVKVELDIEAGMLMIKIDGAEPTQLNDEEIEFSLDSTNGVNGEWIVATEDNSKDIIFKVGKVYVRSKDNPREFRLVATLTQPKAPAGISIGEVNYNDGKMKVQLSGLGDGTTYDISTDGGNNWQTLDSGHWIPLGTGADLRARLGATKNDLPSLATAKLNGLDLSDVKIDVGQGKILNTTTAMEYSLNSGESYSTAKANETQVTFMAGEKVKIREKSKPVNERVIGTVDVEEAVQGVADYNIAEGTITVDNEARALEYRIGNDPWKALGEGTIEFKPGTVQVRAKGTEANLPSEPRDLDPVISSPSSPPELNVDDFEKVISYWDNDEKEWVEIEASPLEYKIGDGSWKDGSEWSDDKKTIKNKTVNISFRVKAGEHKLPSEARIVNFTGNLTFDDVKLNVVEGKIAGTTAKMQYSTNSTDGYNGTWTDAKDKNTEVNFVLGMNVYIREKSKVGNFKDLGTIGIEDALVSEDYDYNIADGTITNETTDVIEYRLGNGIWTVVDRAKGDDEPTTIYGIVFSPGNLQFRRRGTEITLPSSSNTIVIKSRASAPELKYDDVKYVIENIGEAGESDFEYSINGGTWVDGNVNMQFEGGDKVRVRYKATKETLPSLEQEITFTNNLYLGDVVLNAGKLQIQNTTAGMEYSIDSTNGEDGLWFACTIPNTNIPLKADMTVYVREKAKPRNSRIVNTDTIGKAEFSEGFIEKIDYNIAQRTISIKEAASDDQEIVNNLQYRVGGTGNWINVDYVELEDGVDHVLAFNVNFVPGNLEFRLRGDINTLPSDVKVKDVIKTPTSAPSVSKGFDAVKYRNKVEYDEDLGKLEYRFGENDPWIDGAHLENEILNRDVYIRVKAKEKKLASAVKILDFKPVLNLKIVNLSTHVSPIELNGTTIDMEYRINDGIWQACSQDNTQLLRNDGVTPLNNMTAVNKIEIRDKNQHGNLIEIYPQL